MSTLLVILLNCWETVRMRLLQFCLRILWLFLLKTSFQDPSSAESPEPDVPLQDDSWFSVGAAPDCRQLGEALCTFKGTLQ